MRRWPLLSTIVVAVALGLLVGACGGDDDGDDDTRTSPPASQTPFGGGGPPPTSPSRLPPEFVKCMKDRGYEIKSSDDIHSAPPQVLQACFGALHQGGGTP